MTGAPRTIPFGRPMIDESDRAAVLRVLSGPILAHGPEGKAFEAEFAARLDPAGRAACVSVSSCMAALHLACYQLGLRPGDEVIVPALTHVATVHAVEWTGARPIFADCERATGNVCPEAIERAITPRTRAVAVVHFAGIPCAMQEIAGLAARRGLAVIEDCALALGTRVGGVHAGLFGDAGCFSFYPVKHMTTGEGGMFVSRRPDLARDVARTRAFGVDRSHGERVAPGMYEVPSLGLNYRMSEIQAALGRSQLARADEMLAVRRRNFARLKAAIASLGGVSILDANDPSTESGAYCLVLVLDRPVARGDVVARLQAAGIGTSVYYPQPVPRMAYYREKYGYDAARYPEATRISDRSIALPVAPHVSSEDVDYMAETIATVLEAS